MDDGRFFVAVTGAQGVGKSTFCSKLAQALEDGGFDRFNLIDDLRGRLVETGVTLGSASTSETIHAVWVVHLERQDAAPKGRILLDRCTVDALAYTRVLGVSTALERRLFEQVGRVVAPRFDLIIHLALTPFFADKGKPHETAEHRRRVAEEIARILDECGRPVLTVDAADPASVVRSVEAVRAALQRRADA